MPTMKNSRLFTRPLNLRHFSSKEIAGIATAALITVFCAVTAYYYFTTPSKAIVVTAADFPAGLSTNFTADNFTDHVVARLQKMTELADSSDVDDMARQEGLGPRAVRQTLIPIRALSNAPSPVFNRKWKGVDFNFCRSLGISLRAKQFLELGVIGLPEKGWRLGALLKERPHFLAKLAGSAPNVGGSCADFEKCADDLTEQILRLLDNRRLLNFYIKTNTEDANRQILDLYQTTIPPASLQADDLVAWGNALYGLGEFDQALQKYQDALYQNPNSCPARVARGFLYYRRPHGTELLADLQRAEQDFRSGIDCDPKNEFTQTSLCHTLLQKWRHSKNRDDQWLVEAKAHCDKALEINPQFVVAAVNIGYILYRQEKYLDALQHFDNLAHRYPTNSALFLNYGFLLYLEYLKDESKETLKRAATQTLQSWNLNQNSSAAANNLGYFYYELDDYAQAVVFWKKANALNPADADSVAGLALGSSKQGDQRAAITLLSRAIQMDSNYGDPTYLRKNKYWSNRAASDLTALIKLRRAG